MSKWKVCNSAYDKNSSKRQFYLWEKFQWSINNKKKQFDYFDYDFILLISSNGVFN